MSKDKLSPEYLKKIQQIKIDEEAYADKEMKLVYKYQSSKLNEVITFISLLFAAYISKDNLVKVNKKQQILISWKFDTKLIMIGKAIGNMEVSNLERILENTYKDSFIKNVAVMSFAMNKRIEAKLPRQEQISEAVNQPINGLLFKERMWINKANSINGTKAVISEVLQGSIPLAKAIHDIKSIFTAQAYESNRLIKSESARIQVEASLCLAKAIGVKEVEWSAILDEVTNPTDASLDGKRWKITDKFPKPPLHPNCRCILINVPLN